MKSALLKLGIHSGNPRPAIGADREAGGGSGDPPYAGPRKREAMCRSVTRSSILVAACAAGLAAQTEWTAPLAGLLRGPGERVVLVYGMAGNFVAAPGEWTGVQAAAFSGRGGLLKLERELVVLDEAGRPRCRQEAPEGPALLAFREDGRPAAVLISGMAAGGCRVAALEPVAGALAAAVVRGRWQVLANRDDGLWLVTAAGEERLDARRAAAAAFAGEVAVYGAGQELIVRQADGSTETLALPAPAGEMAAMGEHWTAIRAGGLAFALRTAAWPARLYPLPAGEVRP